MIHAYIGFRLAAVGQFCKFNDCCHTKQSLDYVFHIGPLHA